MDRRQFLRTTGIATGGLALAATATAPTHANPTLAAAVALTGVVGWTNNDVDPRTGPLGNLGYTGGVGLDCLLRTVGLDLGSAQQVNAIELTNDRPTHRLNARDLSVHTSNDNANWTKQRVMFTDLGTTIWLHGFDVTARYVAVHCHRHEAATTYTFGTASLPSMITAHRIPAGAFIAGGAGTWPYRTAFQVSNGGAVELRNRAVHVSWAELGASALIAAGKLAADLADLRFADANGNPLHVYDDGDGVFVRIPTLPAGGQTTIHAYSGNPNAVSILADASALQVEYGHRTYRVQSATSAAGLAFGNELHPVRLPDGTLMLAANTNSSGGIHARYSTDDGRTWSIPEPLIAPSNPDLGQDRAGGFHVHPTTGVITAVLYSVGVSSGTDWTDVTQHRCKVWTSRATSYSGGRPVFSPPVAQPITNHLGGAEAAWTLTYTDPVLTPTGALVVSVPYISTAAGQFAIAILRSTDAGVSWTQSASVLSLPSDTWGGASESCLIVRADGALCLLARQQEGGKFHFATSVSSDDGVTWSPLADSTILASNTQPTVLRRNDELLLGWPGHNAMGQLSFQRNNLTLAWSDDDGTTLHGHQDLTTASSLSTPGWKVDADNKEREKIRMLEAFMVPAGTDDLVVGWASGLNPTSGSTLLVEDIDAYLRESHGALDVLRHRDANVTDSGIELAQSRWWRTSPSGSLTLTAGPRSGVQALRLLTTDTAAIAGASRLFPGARSARIRFRLRWTTLGSGLRFAVQEGYSRDDGPVTGANARGTVALFDLGTSGELRTTTDDFYSGIPIGGYRQNDTSPQTGNLSMVGNLRVAFDYQRRSVGLDLQVPRAITSIVLTGDPLSGSTTTRLDPASLGVWRSNNGYGWVQVPGWSGTKSGLQITLSGPEFTAQHVKVTQPWGDTAYTFANEIEEMVTVLPARPDLEERPVFEPLQTPTTLAANTWHTVQLDCDLDADQVVTRMNGGVVSTLPTLRHAETITHFCLVTATGGTTDVQVAEFSVQDTSRGLPAVVRTSTPGGA